MYRGFNLNCKIKAADNNNYYQKGLTMFNNQKTIVKDFFEFIKSDGSIDGSKMQENWFPSINADIFISHSHNDEEAAIIIAGWLNEAFGINAFIDSCIWGYSNDLLWQIDNEYCKIPDSNSYYYENRNFSTSHIHMMLNNAIMKMIDNTECVFFLNTPNSITTSETIKNKTSSPWIYSEITITKLIKTRLPIREKPFIGDMVKTADFLKEAFEITYDLDLKHFEEISLEILDKWKSEYNNEAFPLDILYRIVPAKKKNQVFGG